MQSINELIVIIKGINVDDVITNEEIVSLQLWVDKYGRIAYYKRQIEIIRMVDSVLENKVIYDDEQKFILSACDIFLKEIGNISSRLYELNGIIEGVICDQGVNKIGMLRLKEWMDTYSYCIREHKHSEELFKLIKDILKDGFITEDDQAELLDLLSDRVQNYEFEKKISYLCKLVKDKKNIGVDLIDILNNESAIHEIHKRAERSLRQGLSSYSGQCKNQEIIVVSLVLIGMLEYDGNYYENVRSTYSNLYLRYSEQKIEGKIRSILSKYKKKYESGSRGRIINVALENAIVPKKYLSAFFEFIFDIYKLNFEYDLPEEPYDDFKFVFEGLRNSMVSDGDDISIDVTKKRYKLIASTKHLISRKDEIDVAIKLSIIIAKIIDRYFWDKEVNVYNPYLKSGYEGWKKTLKENTRGGYARRKRDSALRSRWEPKFEIHDNAVYLIPPVHRIKSQYNYRDVTIIVLNNDEEIYRNDNCDIREIIGGYQVSIENIEVTKPLGKIIYRLIVGNEIIYDSKESLYRNYIVFNNEGKELKNNHDFEGAVHIIYKKGEALIDNTLIKESYCIGNKLVREGDAIKIGHDVFNFSSMAKPGIFGVLYPNCMVQREEDEMMISVYRDNCFVVFEADKSSSKFEIVINGKSYKLSEMSYKSTEKVTTIKYVVELDLKKSGIFEIEVNQLTAGKKTRILRGDMAFDMELFYFKEAIEESVYKVQVTSKLIKQSVNTEISPENFDPGFIQFEYRGTHYKYFIPFDFGYYKLSGGEWRSPLEDLWIDDISNKSFLSLYDSECDGVLLYTEAGTLAEDDNKFTDCAYYKQFPINFLTSYKNGSRYTTLAFTVNGKVKYAVRCYNRCVIDKEKTEILCLNNQKKVIITPVFHGKNMIFYELFNMSGDKVLTSNLLQSGQTSTLSNFKSFHEYTIKFYEKTKGLQIRKNILLLEERRTFYATEDFIGKSFKISKVYFNQIVRGKFVEKIWFFNNYFLKLTDAHEGMFKGQIYSKTTNRGDYFLSNINPVDVEICSDVIDGTMDINMTNQGDGLLFDLDKGRILNSMEHPKAPDIFLYTINMKGEEKQ